MSNRRAVGLFVCFEKHAAPAFGLAKVFEVVNEIWQLSTLVDFVARRHDALGERTRPAREHAYFRYIGVLLLYKFEKTRHIGTPEMVHRLEAGKHGRLR